MSWSYYFVVVRKVGNFGEREKGRMGEWEKWENGRERNSEAVFGN